MDFFEPFEQFASPLDGDQVTYSISKLVSENEFWGSNNINGESVLVNSDSQVGNFSGMCLIAWKLKVYTDILVKGVYFDWHFPRTF